VAVGAGGVDGVVLIEIDSADEVDVTTVDSKVVDETAVMLYEPKVNVPVVQFQTPVVSLV